MDIRERTIKLLRDGDFVDIVAKHVETCTLKELGTLVLTLQLVLELCGKDNGDK